MHAEPPGNKRTNRANVRVFNGSAVTVVDRVGPHAYLSLDLAGRPAAPVVAPWR